MGRPKATVNLSEAQIADLAALGCTDAEIATLAGIAESTLQDRFRAQLNEGRARLRHSLRKAQVERAINGSDTMLIWLGKQYLEQRDKNEISGDPQRPLTVFNHGAAVAGLAARPAPHPDAPGADEGGGDG